MIFGNKLKRNIIAKELHNCHNSKNYILDFIKIVEESFSKHIFKSDENFIFGGRKKFLYNEFFEFLNNEKNLSFEDTIYFAIGNLEEFICNNNYGTFSEDVDKSKWINGKIINGKDINELRNKNDIYSKKGIICLEEKDYIIKMIQKLKLYCAKR